MLCYVRSRTVRTMTVIFLPGLRFRERFQLKHRSFLMNLRSVYDHARGFLQNIKTYSAAQLVEKCLRFLKRFQNIEAF